MLYFLLILTCLVHSHRYMVSVPAGVSGLLGSDPSLGGSGLAEPTDQGGSPLWVATCYNSYVN